MSDREKTLGLIVGTLVALLMLFGGYRMVQRGFDQKNGVLADRVSTLREKKAINMQRKRDQMLVAEYQRKSLHDNPETAHLLFQHWLDEQVKEVGLREHRMNFDSIPRTKKTMKELSYLVSGIGDIKQITELLYRVHSADTLHRVRTVDLQQHKDGIKMTARIDAISMPKVQGDKVPIGAVDEDKLALSLEEYNDKISTRNLFAPANRAPEFKSLKTQTVEVGKSMDYNVEAIDPEEHGLIFELDEGAPEWIEISKSGRLSGRPKEEGKHEFKVYVVDRGIPSKEAVGELTVRVVPAKVESADKSDDEIDESKFAVLTAIVQGARDPLPQMCMSYRDKDESQYLQEGDKIKVGEWRAEVVAVDPSSNTVLLKNEDGEFELRLGDALSDARQLEESDSSP